MHPNPGPGQALAGRGRNRHPLGKAQAARLETQIMMEEESPERGYRPAAQARGLEGLRPGCREGRQSPLGAAQLLGGKPILDSAGGAASCCCYRDFPPPLTTEDEA